MRFLRNKRPRYSIQVPLTSLIDIVFLLLIYFMLTTNFMVDEGINIKLPQANAAAPQTKKEITIYVDIHGNAYIANKQIPENELLETLKSMFSGSADQLVIIKADRAIILNKAVKVMDTAKAAGAAKLCLATEK
ncbi:MAG: biopolymer transporter ExbD [Desulfobacterales bacterium]|nr:biopolymer transporter ExbD [Desulfobacterales bacterium]